MSDENSENYFVTQLTVLRIFGMSLEGDESFGYLLYCCVFYTFLFAYTLLELVEVVYTLSDLNAIFNVSVLFTHLSGVLKIAALFCQKSKVQKLLINLEARERSRKTVGVQEQNLIAESVRGTNRTSYIYWTLAFMIVVTGCLHTVANLNSYDRRFPITPLTFINLTDTPLFELTCIYQILACTSYISIVGSPDLLIIGVLSLINAHYNIIQHSFRRIRDGGRNLPETFKELVDYHLFIINICKEFEQTFSGLILVVIFTNALILCSLMYHMSLLAPTDIRVQRDLFFTVAIAGQVFIYCYWGNQVQNSSAAVADACYEVDFVGTDLRFQKDLLMTMVRAQKPVKFTAGKLVEITLNLFVLTKLRHLELPCDVTGPHADCVNVCAKDDKTIRISIECLVF